MRAALDRCLRGTFRAGLLACAAAAGLSAPAARADIVSFDPDGGAAGNGPVAVGSFDFGVGNMLAQGIGPLDTSAGRTFQLYSQAALSGLQNANGDPIGINGLGTTFELTAVSSVTYVVDSVITGASGSTINVSRAGVQAPNSFLEIYYDTAPNANSLAGTGYNDGLRILLASPTAGGNNAGNITATATGGVLDVTQFDQFGTDNYGIQSLNTTGSINTAFNVLSQDPTFFLSPLATFQYTTGSTITPFTQTNPSGLFTGSAGGGAPGVVPVLGTTNGLNGLDFQFQNDGSGSFTVVPEPGSMTLLGLGFAGLLGLRLRRRGAAA